MSNSSRSIGHFPGSFFRRTDRILVGDNGFHYRIREGVSVGPFASESDARSDLEQFINTITSPSQPKYKETPQPVSQLRVLHSYPPKF